MALTATERRVLARKTLITRVWMATGKKVYYAVTRGIGVTDREGRGMRFIREAPEIAARLKTHPQVRDVSIVAFPDRRAGTGLYAFVEGSAGERELGDFLGRASPERLQVVEALPRDAQGEVRSEILELVAMNQIDLIGSLVKTDAERAHCRTNCLGPPQPARPLRVLMPSPTDFQLRGFTYPAKLCERTFMSAAGAVMLGLWLASSSSNAAGFVLGEARELAEWLFVGVPRAVNKNAGHIKFSLQSERLFETFSRLRHPELRNPLQVLCRRIGRRRVRRDTPTVAALYTAEQSLPLRRRDQIDQGLAVLGYKGVQINEPCNAIARPVGHAGRNHATVAVADQHDIAEIFELQYAKHIVDVSFEVV